MSRLSLIDRIFYHELELLFFSITKNGRFQVKLGCFFRLWKDKKHEKQTWIWPKLLHEYNYIRLLRKWKISDTFWYIRDVRWNPKKNVFLTEFLRMSAKNLFWSSPALKYWFIDYNIESNAFPFHVFAEISVAFTISAKRPHFSQYHLQHIIRIFLLST